MYTRSVARRLSLDDRAANCASRPGVERSAGSWSRSARKRSTLSSVTQGSRTASSHATMCFTVFRALILRPVATSHRGDSTKHGEQGNTNGRKRAGRVRSNVCIRHEGSRDVSNDVTITPNAKKALCAPIINCLCSLSVVSAYRIIDVNAAPVTPLPASTQPAP